MPAEAYIWVEYNSKLGLNATHFTLHHFDHLLLILEFLLRIHLILFIFGNVGFGFCNPLFGLFDFLMVAGIGIF